MVGVSAADEVSGNLVDPNILNWKTSTNTTISYFNGIGRLYVNAQDTSNGGDVDWRFYGAYDLPELVVGHSYTASVHFPSTSEINAALGTSLSDTDILRYLDTPNLYIRYGIGYKTSDRMYYVEGK